MAGLWDTWIDKNTGELITSCTIITRPANKDMKSLHDRMPCLLSVEDANVWVNWKLSLDERFAALDPLKDDLLEMKTVNKVGDIDEYKFRLTS
jgi:putative SOS response-associated peptidase YedK